MSTAPSARNGGMVLTGLSASLSQIVKRHGMDLARRLYDESVASVSAVERLVNEAGIDCSFRRTGFLHAAFKPAHAEDLRRLEDLLNSNFGQNTQFIPRERLREELDSQLYHGGLLDPLCAGVHPARYVAGLARHAATLGVGLHEGVEALSIRQNGGGFQVSTSRGSIQAGQVIVGTNGYTGALTPWLRRRIVPVRSLMIATEPMAPEAVAALIPRDRMVADTKIFLYYFRRSPDGRRILFGGRPRSPSLSLAENSVFMRRNMISVFPGLASAGVEYAWGGKLGFTMDHLPHIGRRDDLFYALGYCGHGVALATWLGEKLAGMVLGQAEGDTAFSRPGFRPVPLYTGNPWFMPLIYRYFSLKDRLT